MLNRKYLDIQSKPVDYNNVALKTKRTLAVVPRYAPMLYTVLFLLFIDLQVEKLKLDSQRDLFKCLFLTLVQW